MVPTYQTVLQGQAGRYQNLLHSERPPLPSFSYQFLNTERMNWKGTLIGNPPQQSTARRSTVSRRGPVAAHRRPPRRLHFAPRTTTTTRKPTEAATLHSTLTHTALYIISPSPLPSLFLCTPSPTRAHSHARYSPMHPLHHFLSLSPPPFFSAPLITCSLRVLFLPACHWGAPTQTHIVWRWVGATSGKCGGGGGGHPKVDNLFRRQRTAKKG